MAPSPVPDLDAVLAEVDRWDAGTVATAVVGANGLLAAHGPQDRPYRLASVTKVLVAMAVWVAHEEGALTFDTPAGPPGATVAHLLAHASGLPLEGAAPIAPPGRRRIYSNQGFEVLGRALQDATGIDAATYLHEAVAEPLGLTGTRLDGSPAHGAVGTAADLARVAVALLAPGRVVDPATAARATAVAFPGLDGLVPGFGKQSPNDWGLGVEVRGTKHPHWTGATNDPATFGHFGQAGTFLWVDPVARVGCVALAGRPFDEWARRAWPPFADAVLAAAAGLPPSGPPGTGPQPAGR